MDLLSKLKERFTKAINEHVKPPVLVGPNWLMACPGGKPADFQFHGAPKIAKATKRDTARVAAMLLKQLDLSGLDVTTRIEEDGVISIFVRKPSGTA